MMTPRSNGVLTIVIHTTYSKEDLHRDLQKIKDSSPETKVVVIIFTCNRTIEFLQNITKPDLKVYLYYPLRKFNFDNLLTVIKENKFISELRLDFLPPAKKLQKFIEYLGVNNSLKTIYLGKVSLSKKNFKFLIDTLFQHQSINKIFIDMKNLADQKEFQYFTDTLTNSKSIEEIGFNYAIAEIGPLQSFLNELKKNSNVKQLNISAQSDLAVSEISNCLQEFVIKNKNIVKLIFKVESKNTINFNLKEWLPILEKNESLSILRLPFPEFDLKKDELKGEDLRNVEKFNGILRRNIPLRKYRLSLNLLEANLKNMTTIDVLKNSEFNPIQALGELIEIRTEKEKIVALYKELYGILTNKVRSYGKEQFEELCKLYLYWNKEHIFTNQDNFFLNLTDSDLLKILSDIHSAYQQEILTSFALLISTNICDEFFSSYETTETLSEEDTRFKQNLVIALTWKSQSPDAVRLKIQALASLLTDKNKNVDYKKMTQPEEIIKDLKGVAVDKVVSLDDLNQSMYTDTTSYQESINAIMSLIHQDKKICIIEQVTQNPDKPIEFLTPDLLQKLKNESLQYQSISEITYQWIDSIHKAYTSDSDFNGAISSRYDSNLVVSNSSIKKRSLSRFEIIQEEPHATEKEFAEWVESFQSSKEVFLTNIKQIEINHLAFITSCRWSSTNQYAHYHQAISQELANGSEENMLKLSSDYLEKFREHYARFKNHNHHLFFSCISIRSTSSATRFAADIQNEIEKFENLIQHNEIPSKRQKLEA